MTKLIILEYSTKNIKGYDKIIDLLIGIQKVRYKYPNIDIWCKLKECPILKNPEIKRILSNMYDRVLLSNNYDTTKYDNVKNINFTDINDNYDTDTYYIYNQLKLLLGPVLQKHFMFKERDIHFKQQGGSKFNKNKNVYPNKNTISKLYKLKLDQIKDNHLKYYHILKNLQYRPFNVVPMFNNINEFDFIAPIKKLIDYHSKNSYYQKLYDRNKQYSLNDMKEDDKDSIMLQYIKCRPNTFAITLWKPVLKLDIVTKFIDFLKENGNVYYVKTISLNKNGLRNLLFWYYDDFTYDERLIFIEKKMSYINVSDDNSICFILFDNIHNKKLSGQNSTFKKFIRQKLMDISQLKSDFYRGNDLLHVNDYFYQTIEYSQLILNKNSIDVLNKQDCRIFNTANFSNANLKMQTFRKLIYSEMSLLEIDRLLVIGGIIFYSHGIRAFNDIDALLIDILPNKTDHLVKFIDNYFSNKKTKIQFIVAAIQNSSFWDNTWNTKNAKIFELLNIDNYKDLTLDPANFFYHQGIKIVKIDFEMIRKLIRNRTEDHIDFLMLNLLAPSIIENYIKLNDKTDNLFEVNIKYKNISGSYNDKIPEIKMQILKRRYSNEQINSVKNLKPFINYFLVH